jgi:hypothetical protein
MECPECGTENIENAQYCQECGDKLGEYPKKYGNVSLLGFAGIFLFIPIALICGAYLYTRPEKFAKARGKFIILLSIVLWAIFTTIVLIK